MKYTKNQVSNLWDLSREKYPEKYVLSEKDNKILENEEYISYPILNFKSKNISAFQSHSERSAWIYKPWLSNGIFYPGFEYKGIGNKGNEIKALGKIAWGGLYSNEAILEHNFSKKAFNSGIFCQKPIACYEYGKFNGKKLAVLVRTFVSPLRLSDFHLDKSFLEKYLGFRDQSEKEYVTSLAETLGKNVRNLFDIGLFHGSMEMNNISTEGELADFEPTNGGTWEGVMRSKESKFRVLALSRLFSAINDVFSEKDIFPNVFIKSFFGKQVNLKKKYLEKEIVEKYTGKKLTEEELTVDFPEFKNIEKVRSILKTAKNKAISEKEKERIDFILNELD